MMAEQSFGQPIEVAVPAPATETQPTRVEDVARAAIERADRPRDRDRKRGDKGDKKAPATESNQEFWETWAADKATRAPEPKSVAAPAAAPVSESDDDAPAAEASSDEVPAKRERGGRDRGRSSERGDKKRSERGGDEKRASSKREDKPAAAAAAPAPAAAADGSQAKLFVSLGKKHGVSADDIRAMLAKPVGGDKARIGSVSLRDSHAHVRVGEGDVDVIIAALHGTQHNDHDITVERARA